MGRDIEDKWQFLSEFWGKYENRKTQNNNLAIINNTKDACHALLNVIDKAKSSIRLETYIFDDTPFSIRVVDALLRAADRGCKITVITDGFGSSPQIGDTLSTHSNIEFYMFNPLKLILKGFHSRTHRKILVVDDKYGSIGSMNIGSDAAPECMGGKGANIELVTYISGDIIEDVIYTFDESLNDKRCVKTVTQNESAETRQPPNIGGRWLDWFASYFRTDDPKSAMLSGLAGTDYTLVNDTDLMLVDSRSELAQQLIPSGIGFVFYEILNFASKEIYIGTPLFHPPKHLQNLLRHLIKKGAKIQVLLSGKSSIYGDVLASCTILRRISDGIKLNNFKAYFSTKSFIHAKFLLADGLISMWGSANWDRYSLRYNSEVGLVSMDPRVYKHMKRIWLNMRGTVAEDPNWSPSFFDDQMTECVDNVQPPMSVIWNRGEWHLMTRCIENISAWFYTRMMPLLLIPIDETVSTMPRVQLRKHLVRRDLNKYLKRKHSDSKRKRMDDIKAYIYNTQPLSYPSSNYVKYILIILFAGYYLSERKNNDHNMNIPNINKKNILSKIDEDIKKLKYNLDLLERYKVKTAVVDQKPQLDVTNNRYLPNSPAIYLHKGIGRQLLHAMSRSNVFVPKKLK